VSLARKPRVFAAFRDRGQAKTPNLRPQNALLAVRARGWRIFALINFGASHGGDHAPLLRPAPFYRDRQLQPRRSCPRPLRSTVAMAGASCIMAMSPEPGGLVSPAAHLWEDEKMQPPLAAGSNGPLRQVMSRNAGRSKKKAASTILRRFARSTLVPPTTILRAHRS